MVSVSSFQSPPLKPLTIAGGMSIERSSRASALAKYSQWPCLAVDQEVFDGVELVVDRLPSAGCKLNWPESRR